MKRPQTIESKTLMDGKKGDVFYTHHHDRYMTAVAHHYGRKVATKRLLIVDRDSMTVDNITKVIILK